MSARGLVWLGRTEVLALHAKMIGQYGGTDALRDESALLAGLNRARNLQAYGDPPPDVAELAAVYAGGVVLNHPFVDGNKRTGFMMAYAFIRLNGFDFTAPEHEAVIWTLKLAARACEEKDYAAWLRSHAKLAVAKSAALARSPVKPAKSSAAKKSAAPATKRAVSAKKTCAAPKPSRRKPGAAA